MLRIAGGTLLAAGLLFGLMRCDLAGPVERHSLVVEAFLKTGEELPTITLRHTRPVGAPGDSVSEGAMGADVQLHLDETRISYVPADDRPGRYVPDTTDGSVSEGVDWELTAEWQGETARASGTTPPPIEVTQVCVDVPETPVEAVHIDSLRRDSLDIPAEQGYIYPVDVTVRWPAAELASDVDTSHWVRAQLPAATFSSEFIGLFLQPAEVRREDQFEQQRDERQWQGVYAVPVEDEEDPLPRHRLTVALTRGDSSFAAFARSRTDPERRDPISNVEGGIGIATAVAVDSMKRTVASDIERCRRSR